jgi:hypothetical protein
MDHCLGEYFLFRQLRNLILDSLPQAPTSRNLRRRDSDASDLERLNAIEREVNKIQFDLRVIREDVHWEAAHTNAGPQPKRNQRPFHRLVAAQQEKNKRDRNLRERLEKERKQEQHRIDKRDEYLSKAMNPRRPYTPTQRQHRMKKSGSAAFFQQLMRPISNAFALDYIDVNTTRRTAGELDFMPTHKPALVLSVVDARISSFINYERSYTFQLDTEDGGHYLLQAATKAEMTKWIRTIDHVSKTAAKRRLTYLGNSPKPQLSDHIHDHPTTASRDPIAGKSLFLSSLSPLLTVVSSFWCRPRIFTPTRGRRLCDSSRCRPIFLGKMSVRGRGKRLE